MQSEPHALNRRIAAAYEADERYAAAAPYWDRVAADATSDTAKTSALNAGCWSRAEAGVELDRALKACNEALRLRPGAPDILDSRGLVEVRLHAFDRAVEDYTAALAKHPGGFDFALRPRPGGG